MKRVFLFLSLISLAVLTQSCGDDDKVDNPATSINPPQWIQGSWAYIPDEEFPEISMPMMKFTQDDFLLLSGDGSSFQMENSIKQLLSQLEKAGSEVSVVQEKTDSYYYIKLNIPVSVTLPTGYKYEYKLQKVNEDKLLWVNHPISESQKIYLIRMKQ